MVIIGHILGFDRDDGKENGNYHTGFRVLQFPSHPPSLYHSLHSLKGVPIMYYSLNSLKGSCRGLYVRAQGLGSTLVQGCYMGDYNGFRI